jgi:hypothetical protein
MDDFELIAGALTFLFIGFILGHAWADMKNKMK